MTDGRVPEPDAVLFERVQAGDKESFSELARRYEPALARVARSRLGRADWAEEVVQETFLAAFKSCASYDSRFAFRTWLWTILLNQCARHYQRRMRGVQIEPWPQDREAFDVGQGDAQSGSPLGKLLAKERTAELESLLAQLSVVQADALRLRFFGGLKYQEIAEAMGCSLNTAKNRVRWGLTRMAELIQTAGSSVRPHGDGVRPHGDEDRERYEHEL